VELVRTPDGKLVRYRTGFEAEFVLAATSLSAEVAVCPPAVLGALEILAAITVDSVVAPAASKLIVIGITAVSPTRAVGIVPTVIDEIVAALAAGTESTESMPKPKAETATSAMRLRVVFVDICFLSIKVDPRAFLESAW
jgi:hypothetical protein